MRAFWIIATAGLAGCPTEPPEPEPVWLEPFTEDVVFPGTDFDLEGTYHVPGRWSDAKLSAVILMHDDGIVSRDGVVTGQLNMDFGFGIPTHVQLAESLAEQGLGVLRYDKRNCGTWNGRCENAYPELKPGIRMNDYVDDAACALSWLSSQPEIERTKVTMVGHGQSAGFLAEVLLRRGMAAGGVMFGAPYRSPEVLLAERIASAEAFLLASGRPQTEVDAELADERATQTALEELRAGTFVGETIDGQPVSYWDSWFFMADRAMLITRTIYRPILALYGDADLTVPVTEFDSWVTAFEESSSLPREARTLPCVSHAMNCLAEGDPLLFAPEDAGTTVDPALATAIGEFALAR